MERPPALLPSVGRAGLKGMSSPCTSPGQHSEAGPDGEGTLGELAQARFRALNRPTLKPLSSSNT